MKLPDPDDLKGCPFCGHPPVVEKSSVKNWCRIRCGNKKCIFSPHVEGYIPKVVKAWQKRNKEN